MRSKDNYSGSKFPVAVQRWKVIKTMNLDPDYIRIPSKERW